MRYFYIVLMVTSVFFMDLNAINYFELEPLKLSFCFYMSTIGFIAASTCLLGEALESYFGMTLDEYLKR